MLRAALTVTLLCLACGLLYAGQPGGSCPAPAGAPATARSPVRGATPPDSPVGGAGEPEADAFPSGSGSPPGGGFSSGGDAEEEAGGGRNGRGQAPAGRALPAGMLGVAVRIAEPAVLAVVRPGTRIDLLATQGTADAGGPNLLAAGALVLDVMRPETADGSAALYLALRPEQAHRTAGVPTDARFTVVVRP